ncbi:amino acid permease [Clostridium perfringens]|uniref:amino acid permease n=1 Tax=Clostridium perfringens TaxID=1502 RepID=UPI0018D5DD75|nr:amino acid permease [Clostridium perfringens]QPS29619.1 amino acid permease [Clostridium perfringens]STB44553.1 amino acid permease [Clostridium perfringens]
MSQEQNTNLKRGLKSRHLSMIAMGGAIGTGIFLAMGDTLHQAGVGGAFVAYGIIGVMVYFLCTSLGEMATYMPETGSFGAYATKFVDPALGFALGWNYWYNWAITIAAEMVAGSLLMKFWFPNVPAIVWSALFLVIILTLNLLSAKAYGESEFWFAAVKVATVIIFLIVGVLMIFGILGGDNVGFKNFYENGGPFIGGAKSIFMIFLIAGFSFQGTELVGVAAGESEDPEKNVPKAVNTIFWRILLFYLGTILVIGALVPNAQAGVETSAFTIFMIFLIAGFSFQGTELVGVAAGESEDPEKNVPKAVNTIFWRILLFYLGTILVIGALVPNAQAGVETSAFTIVFEKLGLAGAASIMNAIILTSVLSAGNSGMYASSRMLYAMAKSGMAPKIFEKTNSRGVPVNAIIITTIIASLCFLTGIYAENTVYVWLVAASGLSGFIAWLGIAICHYRFRKAYVAQGKDMNRLVYKAKLFPLGPIIALILCGIIVLGQGYAYLDVRNGVDWGGLISSYIGLPLFFGLFAYYKIKYKTKIIDLKDVDLSVEHIDTDESIEDEVFSY